MRFHANHVSTAVSGGYYGAYFESIKDGSDPGAGSYLSIQRQFEIPDGGGCEIETHDKRYFGHWRIRSMEFSQNGMVLEIARPVNRMIEITFSLTAEEFEAAEPILKIISGERRPPFL